MRIHGIVGLALSVGFMTSALAADVDSAQSCSMAPTGLATSTLMTVASAGFKCVPGRYTPEHVAPFCYLKTSQGKAACENFGCDWKFVID